MCGWAASRHRQPARRRGAQLQIVIQAAYYKDVNGLGTPGTPCTRDRIASRPVMRRTHCPTQGSPQGPTGDEPGRQDHLQNRGMEVTAPGPVERRRRGCLQHLQQRLGILDRTMPSSTIAPLSSRRTLTAGSPSNPAPAGPRRRPAGSCRHTLGAGKQPLHRLEHDFEAVADGVDLERGDLAAGLGDDNELGLGPAARPARQLHQLRQRADRHDPVAQHEAVVVLDLADPVRRQANGLRSRHPSECRTPGRRPRPP